MSGAALLRGLPPALSLLGALAVALSALAPASPVLAQASAAANMTASRYDAARRVTGTIAPDPDGSGPVHFAAVRTTYDAQGLPTKVESGITVMVWTALC